LATDQLNRAIQHLRQVVLPQDGAGRTDGQLLESFVSEKDEAAFAALVHRHGSMVLGVCRRVLRNHHDAEDAFQATFLVLARKAWCVRPTERVANWLHGVAYRTALKARAIRAKRQVRETQVREMSEPELAPQDHWRDLQCLLDEELGGLPEIYRLPILLCDLEGKSIKEAARQLGWPQGTVAGRLARGRRRLAKRLTRRGLVLSAASLAALPSENVASAAVPTSLVSSTIQAASLFTAGKAAATGAISAKVVALTEGVLKTMLLTKLKLVTVLLLVIPLTTAAGLIYQTPAAQPANGQRASAKLPEAPTADDADQKNAGGNNGRPALNDDKDQSKEKPAANRDQDRDIEKALSRPVNLNFKDVPLRETLDDVRSYSGLNIVLDLPALEQNDISLDTPVTLRLDNVSLKSALKLLLEGVKLTYIVREKVIVVTTPKDVDGKGQSASLPSLYPSGVSSEPASRISLPTSAMPRQAIVSLDKGLLVVRTLDVLYEPTVVQSKNKTHMGYQKSETLRTMTHDPEMVRVYDVRGKRVGGFLRIPFSKVRFYPPRRTAATILSIWRVTNSYTSFPNSVWERTPGNFVSHSGATDDPHENECPCG
jgi:RNA polymerase sigma factor (sigma-70 family)